MPPIPKSFIQIKIQQSDHSCLQQYSNFYHHSAGSQKSKLESGRIQWQFGLLGNDKSVN